MIRDTRTEWQLLLCPNPIQLINRPKPMIWFNVIKVKNTNPMLYHGRSIDPAADAAGGKCVCMHMHRGCAPAKQRSTQSQAAAKFPWYSEKIGLYFFPFSLSTWPYRIPAETLLSLSLHSSSLLWQCSFDAGAELTFSLTSALRFWVPVSTNKRTCRGVYV